MAELPEELLVIGGETSALLQIGDGVGEQRSRLTPLTALEKLDREHAFEDAHTRDAPGAEAARVSRIRRLLPQEMDEFEDAVFRQRLAMLQGGEEDSAQFVQGARGERLVVLGEPAGRVGLRALDFDARPPGLRDPPEGEQPRESARQR